MLQFGLKVMLNCCSCFEFGSYEKKLEKALKEKSPVPEPTLFEESKEQLESMDTELRTLIDLLTPFATTRTET